MNSRVVEAARTERARLGAYKESAVLDVAAFLESNHPVRVFEAAGWDSELSAVTIRRPRPQPAVIGVNRNHTIGRRNFSLAHELGHLLLHAGGTGHVGQFRPQMEREADLFALEFLVPERLVRAWCEAYRPRSPQGLARRICLSRTVVERRLREFGLLEAVGEKRFT